MSTLQQLVGKNIRAIRKQKGLSQEEFALKSKLDRSYMGRIERGEANITLKIIAVLSDTLECKPDRLFIEQ